MKKFIAILLLSGIVSMPAYTDYWSNELRFSKIADIMPLKRFQKSQKFFHLTDSILLMMVLTLIMKYGNFQKHLRHSFLRNPAEKKI